MGERFLPATPIASTHITLANTQSFDHPRFTEAGKCSLAVTPKEGDTWLVNSWCQPHQAPPVSFPSPSTLPQAAEAVHGICFWMWRSTDYPHLSLLLPLCTVFMTHVSTVPKFMLSLTFLPGLWKATIRKRKCYLSVFQVKERLRGEIINNKKESCPVASV